MKLTNLNIVWYVLCWNEMPILPFMIDYWKLIANKVIVLDNNSSDGSVDYLKQYDWIEVRPYPIKTNDELNDDIHRRIKNDCWKEQKGKDVDWVIVSDLDEILWAKDLQNVLQMGKDAKIAVLLPEGYDFVSLTYPEHIEGKLLHEQVKNCMRLPMWDKPIIFNPDYVKEINYSPGAHSARPECSHMCMRIKGLYLFHFKYLGLEYLINKRFATAGRMSDINKKNNWGFEYLYDKQQIEKQFNDRWDKAKDFSVDTLLK